MRPFALPAGAQYSSASRLFATNNEVVPQFAASAKVRSVKPGAETLAVSGVGSRMAGIISLCGWDHVTENPSAAPVGIEDVACMRMVVNIYIYAMMQGA